MRERKPFEAVAGPELPVHHLQQVLAGLFPLREARRPVVARSAASRTYVSLRVRTEEAADVRGGEGGRDDPGLEVDEEGPRDEAALLGLAEEDVLAVVGFLLAVGAFFFSRLVEREGGRWR